MAVPLYAPDSFTSPEHSLDFAQICVSQTAIPKTPNKTLFLFAALCNSWSTQLNSEKASENQGWLCINYTPIKLEGRGGARGEEEKEVMVVGITGIPLPVLISEQKL